MSLPVLYSDSSSTGPPAALNGPPRMPPNCPRQSLNMVGQRYKEEQRRTLRSGRSQVRRWSVERVTVTRNAPRWGYECELRLQGSGADFRRGCKGGLVVPRSRWSGTTRSLLPPPVHHSGGIRAPCRDSKPWNPVVGGPGPLAITKPNGVSLRFTRDGSASGQLFSRSLLCRLSLSLRSSIIIVCKSRHRRGKDDGIRRRQRELERYTYIYIYICTKFPLLSIFLFSFLLFFFFSSFSFIDFVPERSFLRSKDRAHFSFYRQTQGRNRGHESNVTRNEHKTSDKTIV